MSSSSSTYSTSFSYIFFFLAVARFIFHSIWFALNLFSEQIFVWFRPQWRVFAFMLLLHMPGREWVEKKKKKMKTEIQLNKGLSRQNINVKMFLKQYIQFMFFVFICLFFVSRHILHFCHQNERFRNLLKTDVYHILLRSVTSSTENHNNRSYFCCYYWMRFFFSLLCSWHLWKFIKFFLFSSLISFFFFMRLK